MARQFFTTIFGLFYFVLPAAASLLVCGKAGVCDSSFFSNAKSYGMKRLPWDCREVTIAFSDNLEGKRRLAPWKQIVQNKRNRGNAIDSLAKITVSVPNTESRNVEKQVNKSLLLAVASIPTIFLFGLGGILGVIILFKTRRLANAIVGHPKENRLRRKIAVARLLALLAIISTLVLLIGILLPAIFQAQQQ